MSTEIPVYQCFLGDVITVELEFTDDDESPMDLTGSTVYITAKNSLSDGDDVAVIDEKITAHLAAADGKTTVEIDLSGESLTSPLRLTADIVLVDAQGGKQNYGLFIIAANAPVTRATTD